MTTLDLFGRICDRTTELLAAARDWGASGHRDGQYAVDLDLDAACVDQLHRVGLAVLSEESGLTGTGIGAAPPADVVVVDPLDGSTNAALGLPWCATALCLVREHRPLVAMVANLRTGDRYSAVAGSGAQHVAADGSVTTLSITGGPTVVAEAIVGVNARPPDSFHPRQYRALGATALDLVSVASGGFDGYVDFDDDRIGVWDYLAAALIVTEAGGVVEDVLGRELVALDPATRRRPIAAVGAELLAELRVAAR